MADEHSDNGEGYERPRGEDAAEVRVSKEGDTETGIKVKTEEEEAALKTTADSGAREEVWSDNALGADWVVENEEKGKQSQPTAEQMAEDEGKGGGKGWGKNPKLRVLSGDWVCGECANLVFARHYTCPRCESPWQNRRLERCRFFQSSGGCRNGSKCLFVHESDEAQPQWETSRWQGDAEEWEDWRQDRKWAEKGQEEWEDWEEEAEPRWKLIAAAGKGGSESSRVEGGSGKGGNYGVEAEEEIVEGRTEEAVQHKIPIKAAAKTTGVPKKSPMVEAKPSQIKKGVNTQQNTQTGKIWKKKQDLEAKEGVGKKKWSEEMEESQSEEGKEEQILGKSISESDSSNYSSSDSSEEDEEKKPGKEKVTGKGAKPMGKKRDEDDFGPEDPKSARKEECDRWERLWQKAAAILTEDFNNMKKKIMEVFEEGRNTSVQALLQDQKKQRKEKNRGRRNEGAEEFGKDGRPEKRCRAESSRGGGKDEVKSRREVQGVREKKGERATSSSGRKEEIKGKKKK